MPEALQEDLLRRQVDRVLSSNTFRSCGSLRRLLEFLANCALNGDTRDLKEYRIGVEGLGKHASYDPRVDPSVRVQVGRLRSRLAEYYLNEGRDDPIVLTVPKGGFSVAFEHRGALADPNPGESVSTPGPAVPVPAPRGSWPIVAAALGIICAILLAFALFRPGLRQAQDLSTEQSQDFQELWRPYLLADRPLLISLGVPLGLRFETRTPEGESLVGHIRDGRLNQWPDSPDSEAGKRLQLWQQHLKVGALEASYQYMAVGESIAAILLATALGRQTELTIVRSNMLSWDAAKGANLVFIGAAKFNPHLRNVPFSRNFRIGDFHVHNLHPGTGEKAAYPDIPGPTDRRGAALIGRYRSPGGGSWFTLVGSANSMCTWAAIEYLTRPEYVAKLTSAMRQAFGRVPDSFEAVVEASFDQSSPVEVHHVVLRALSP